MNNSNHTVPEYDENKTGEGNKGFISTLVSDFRSYIQIISGNPKAAKIVKATMVTLALISSVVFVIAFLLYLAPGIQELFSGKRVT